MTQLALCCVGEPINPSFSEFFFFPLVDGSKWPGNLNRVHHVIECEYNVLASWRQREGLKSVISKCHHGVESCLVPPEHSRFHSVAVP